MIDNYELRCPNCNRLLCKVSGLGTYIEIQCPKCKALVTWPTLQPEILAPDRGRIIGVTPLIVDARSALRPDESLDEVTKGWMNAGIPE